MAVPKVQNSGCVDILPLLQQLGVALLTYDFKLDLLRICCRLAVDLLQLLVQQIHNK